MPAPIGIPVGLAIARAVAGIVGKGAQNVAPVYKNMGTGSVKVVPSKGMKNYTGDTDDLTILQYNRIKASAPINSLARGKNAIRVTSSTKRGN